MPRSGISAGRRASKRPKPRSEAAAAAMPGGWWTGCSSGVTGFTPVTVNFCYNPKSRIALRGDPTMREGTLYGLRPWEVTALGAFAAELIGVWVYAWAVGGGTSVFGILFLLGLAAAGGGGVIGFVFGVPRVRADAHPVTAFLHNSNLEQISDWLTKIIIGATLVQIKEIADGLGRVSLFIGNEIGARGSNTVAAAVIVFSFFAGFMWAYLWMSVRLKGEFEDVANQLKALGIVK
jgi:hypothetical protein